MAESRSFSPEIWASDREAFIFRFRDRRFGDLVTFCVSEITLKELRPEHPFLRWKAFDALRSLIYEAAAMRIRTGSLTRQHVMTTQELRALRQGRRHPHFLAENDQPQQGLG